MTGFDELVGRIYEAAAEPDTWMSVLHDIARSVDAVFGALAVTRNDKWVGWRFSADAPVTVRGYLSSAAATRSQVTVRLIEANRAGFVPDQDLMPEEAWLADPLMSEYASPAGLHHAAGTFVRVPTGDVAVVHIHRRTGLPGFGASDLARLDAFRPHLARAAMLAVRWRLQRLRAAAEALALVGLPAAIVDLGGRVLIANDLMARVSSWIVWLPGDRIALVDSGANELLRRAVHELRDPAADSVRSIPIKSGGTTGAAVAHLVPATGRARELFDGAFGILVITPVAASSALATDMLHALFDLTPSEVRVAAGIAQGLSLEQIATRHSVTTETVRAQTKAVFAKTGTHRQAQVAALLVNMQKMPIA